MTTFLIDVHDFSCSQLWVFISLYFCLFYLLSKIPFYEIIILKKVYL